MKDVLVRGEIIEHALIGGHYAGGFSGLEIEMKNGVQYETYRVNGTAVVSKPAGQLTERDVKTVISAFATVDGWLYQRVLRERTQRTYTAYTDEFESARIFYDFCYGDPDVDPDEELIEAANRTDYYGGDDIA